MRWVLLASLLATTAFAGGRVRFGVGANVGLGPAWTGINTSGRPVPLVPITNFTAGARPGFPAFYPGYYWYSMPAYEAPPPPPPPPSPVVIEREVVIERPAPAPVAPPPPPAPQVIVIEHPVPAPAPVPPEPPKPPAPRTPGPDVFSWTDADGVVNYSTRAPSDPGIKAKKLATLAK